MANTTTYHGPYQISDAKAHLEIFYKAGLDPVVNVLRSRLGGQGKLTGMLQILRGSLHDFAHELQPMLMQPMQLFFNFNDFPSVSGSRRNPGHRLRLPMFAMSASDFTTEVPIPDFTFFTYSKVTGVKSSHWPVLSAEIARSAPRWDLRRDVLFWRGCVGGSRIRSFLFPRFRNLSANALPVALDADDSGWFGRHKEVYTSLPDQCKSKFLLHMDGNAYSAGLKYKLACGSLVIVVRSSYHEFFYPGLVDGQHYVSVAAPRNIGKNEQSYVHTRQFNHFVKELANLLDRYQSPQGAYEAQQIGANGQEFATRHLSFATLSCYW
eukprot:CAMPEP_0119307372 /NCGR_PEP_ID=MMETSP1333-20130426/7898_1 /TAXON_ID=418940 /ORGANISM="Scyphosphaera apsteinii, Strain RCC1455" /LENGTH=322 /DNA_ID=CAMNT_0007310911 /DNA_START=267 /DNA_END=1232 /DNA_ORIENTATION=+